MLDKTKRYLVVGLGLLGGKYALELTKAQNFTKLVYDLTSSYSTQSEQAVKKKY